MAFDKDADWKQLQGQDLPTFNLESTMHQPRLSKNKTVTAGLEKNMKQPAGRAGSRSFALKSPNSSMKQGGK
jgi:hypothetical protein